MINGVQKHKVVCDRLNKLYSVKNERYGDSFSNSYKQWGIASPVIRLQDKMNRICELTKNPKLEAETDESLYDSIIDLANYAIMTAMELEEVKEGN